MKNLIIPLLCVFCTFLAASAQESGLNDNADNIIGNYYVNHGGEESKVKIFKTGNGTYSAQITWVKNSLDKNGDIRLDEKNPDKSLRNTPCDRIILIEGLEYNKAKKRWDSGKIYDPTRGIRANATCTFEPDGNLKIRGSLLGFGETIIWKRLSE